MTKRNMDIPGAKRLILSLAAAGTIGMWAVFARIERNASTDTTDVSTGDSAFHPVEAPAGAVIHLPPIPTLVPTLASNNLVIAGGQAEVTLAPTASSLVLPTPSGLLWKPPSSPQAGMGNPGGGKAKPNRSEKQQGPSAGSGSSH